MSFELKITKKINILIIEQLPAVTSVQTATAETKVANFVNNSTQH